MYSCYSQELKYSVKGGKMSTFNTQQQAGTVVQKLTHLISALSLKC